MDSRFMTTALSGTSTDRKTTSSSTKLSTQHGTDEPGQPLGQHGGEVDARGRLAADVGHDARSRPRPRPAARPGGGGAPAARWPRTAAPSWGRPGPRRWRPRGWPAMASPTATPGVSAHGLEHRRHRRRGGRVRRLEHQGQRAVDPGAEPVGQAVVGLRGSCSRPGRCRRRRWPGACDSTGAARSDQGAGAGHRGEHRATLHAASPSVGRRSPGHPAVPAAMDAEPVDASADDAEQRGQQRDGGQHGDEHRRSRCRGPGLPGS